MQRTKRRDAIDKEFRTKIDDDDFIEKIKKSRDAVHIVLCTYFRNWFSILPFVLGMCHFQFGAFGGLKVSNFFASKKRKTSHGISYITVAKSKKNDHGLIS